MYNYSVRYDLFFIHIPKTAGTSIHTALEIEPDRRGHRTLETLYDLYGTTILKTPCFTVVRNPWDRMVSLYEFRKQKKDIPSSYTFKKWLLKGAVSIIERMNCVDIVALDGTKPVEVLRYENLAQEWNNFAIKYKIETKELPKLNAADKRADYRNYYDQESLKLVEKVFEKDIKQFNYNF
jgi:hypothetical protein